MLAIVVILLIPATSIFWLSGWLYQPNNQGFHFPEPWRCLAAVLAPLFMAAYGLRRKSLCRSGAIAGLLVGFLLTLSSLCFFAALLAFFVSASRATKYRAHLKKKLEDEYKEGGQRDWTQVVCNGGVAAWLAVVYMMETGCVELPINFSRHYEPSWLALAVLGSLACSCGDTFASEFGSVLGVHGPRLITTFKAVPRGTNGGVSVAGTLASGLGGLVVGVSYHAALLLTTDSAALPGTPPQWPVIVVGLLAGLIGSGVDSYLGALFQYSGFSRHLQKVVESPGPGVTHITGVGLLDNHSVNLLASLITALITPIVAIFIVWPLLT